MIKQYNLVPSKERLRTAAGKITVDLASHWPCITYLVVYPPTGSWPMEGRSAHCLWPEEAWQALPMCLAAHHSNRSSSLFVVAMIGPLQEDWSLVYKINISKRLSFWSTVQSINQLICQNQAYTSTKQLRQHIRNCCMAWRVVPKELMLRLYGLPSIATPAIRPSMAKRDIIHKTGST